MNQVFLGSQPVFWSQNLLIFGVNATAGSRFGSGTRTGMVPSRCERATRGGEESVTCKREVTEKRTRKSWNGSQQSLGMFERKMDKGRNALFRRQIISATSLNLFHQMFF